MQKRFDSPLKLGRMRTSQQGRLAQLVEQCPYKAWVTSSSLVPPTSSFSGKHLAHKATVFLTNVLCFADR